LRILQQLPALTIVSCLAAIFKWFWIVPVIAKIVLFAAMAVLALAPFAKQPWTVSLRAVVFLLIWPLVFLLALPGTMLTAAAAVALAVFVLPRTVVSMLPKEWLHTYQLVEGALTVDTGKGDIAGVLTLIAVVSILYLPLRALHRLLHRLLSPTLKIIADVVLYLGDANYRLRLWDYMQRSMEEFGRAGIKNLMLLSHSLGTVICVDVLRFRYKDSGARVTLVTGGSPLARLFHRFFPESYPATCELLSGFRRQFRDFTWVNVYRPNDPIGTSLGLPACWDISTEQHELSGFAAHASYWDDPIVHELGHAATLKQPPDSRQDSVDTASLAASRFAHRSISSASGLWVHWLVLGSLCAGACFAIWHHAMKPIFEADEILREIGASSVRDNAYVMRIDTVEYFYDADGVKSLRSSRYAIQSIPPRTVPGEVIYVERTLCDMSKLNAAFRKNGSQVQVPHPISGKLAGALPVVIRYPPGKASAVAVEQCMRERIPTRMWAGSLFIFLALSAFAWYCLYGFVRIVLFSSLATFVGTTDTEYERAEQSIGLIDREGYFDGLRSFAKLVVFVIVPIYLFSQY
jgi:hypothetical protein